MKTAFDSKHVKSVSVIVLLNKNKDCCGRIIAGWSDNPAGSVCTATVHLYNNAPTARNKEDFVNETGRAGGYGYDKLSSAIYEALRKAKLTDKIKVHPAAGNQRQAFEDAGFIVIEAL